MMTMIAVTDGNQHNKQVHKKLEGKHSFIYLLCLFKLCFVLTFTIKVKTQYYQ